MAIHIRLKTSLSSRLFAVAWHAQLEHFKTTAHGQMFRRVAPRLLLTRHWSRDYRFVWLVVETSYVNSAMGGTSEVMTCTSVQHVTAESCRALLRTKCSPQWRSKPLKRALGQQMGRLRDWHGLRWLPVPMSLRHWWARLVWVGDAVGG